jgi:glycolate oxidase iron-sulfur subunit
MSAVARWDPDLLAPATDDVVKCVACGLCLPHCPTFRLTGRETASPRGRIAAMRAVEEGHGEVDASFTTMMDECLACRACEAACPSGVPFGRMIEAARAQAEPTRSARERGVKRLGLAGVLPRPRLVLAAGWLLAAARALRLDRLAPPAQRASTPPATLREMLLPIPERLGAGPTATVLSGCVMEVAFRPVQRATMRAVAAAGHLAVRTAPGACCGALAMHHGQPEAAREMARARIPELEAGEIVVVNASGCSAHVRAYGELLADDPAWAERAERVAARVLDLIELELPERNGRLGRVAVHDACHHLHAQRIEPRAMLRRAGAECVDLGDGGRCCGAAGLYSVLQPELAGRLRRQKAEAIAAAGAPVVAVANPGCAIQIAAGLREIGSTTRVAHPAELVAPARPEELADAGARSGGTG